MINNFDYKGLSAETLEAMCSSNYGALSSVQDKFWVTQTYSMGQFIREYAYIPQHIPLNCYSIHGVHHVGNAAPHETDNDAPFYICCNKIQYDAYTQKSQKPCYITPTPLPWLRRQHKKQKNPLSQGTLAFFQHTTPDVGFLESIEEVTSSYINELLALPQIMHPIAVCLHMHDIRKGYHKFFLDHGVPVYSAGNVYNPLFYEEFYNILLNFSFTTSNHIGSYTFYAIEADVPFYFHGKKRKYYNISDPNIKQGFYDDKTSVIEHWLEKLFSTFSQNITEKQRAVVATILGEKDTHTSRMELNKIICSHIK